MSDNLKPETGLQIRQMLTSETLPSLLVLLFYFNAYFTIMRLQDFPGFSILGTIRLPALLTVIVGLGFIQYCFSLSYSSIFKITFIFILIEGLRGIFGFLILDSFVVNDALQFHTWRDIVMYLTTIMAPIVYVSSRQYRLRKLIQFFVFVAFCLSIWTITHSGKGPGGYIGDENDNCLMLTMLLPLALQYTLYSQNTFIKKLFGALTALLLVGGAIATNSRGGFLGLVAVFLVLFLLSKRKILWIVGFSFASLIIFPFVPEQYYREIKSIQTDSVAKKSTIQERFETWGIIYRMWKDPRNTIQGVGLANSKFNMGPYEPLNINDSRRSLVGRVAHSFYFQVLGDLGLWGITIFGLITFKSLALLRKIKKEGSLFLYRLNSLSSLNRNKTDGLKKFDNLPLRSFLETEVHYVEMLSRMIICSWVGLLVSGLGISVSYYPPFWLIAALSLGVALYFEKLKNALSLLEDEVNEKS